MDLLPLRSVNCHKKTLVTGCAACRPYVLYFDVEDCLAGRIAEQNALGLVDEPGDLITPAFWINPPLEYPDLPPATSPISATSALKQGSKRRRRERREACASTAATSGSPPTKSVSIRHLKDSLKQAITVQVDAQEFSHSRPVWIGMHSAEGDNDYQNGIGGRVYMSAEIQALTGSADLTYVNWLGCLSIPIVDSKGCIIAVLGGMPRDVAGWKKVTDSASKLFAEGVADGSFTPAQLNHRRAQEPYPLISRGVSHGGGQLEPGELCNNEANTELTNRFLREDCFKCLAGFANCLFRLFAPILFAFYQSQMACIAEWRPSLHWNFAHSDLKLVFRFPPRATILVPSAIVRHSNVPVRINERRYSFTQYTAGGLFRWVRNGFRTDVDFANQATHSEQVEHEEENLTRWEKGVAMYSTLDDLRSQ
ncbi:hypothetical protein DFH07DRAFT_952772 [Mycena maculata]|uniref:Uncharacterized protein n=1 Tax=Mycena maculata TaxID=230809 RepID=A0AAD7JX49_9AGAR|nr:hypothetical protein DFH07DRAFT_952772 [Mycena maculata]